MSDKPTESEHEEKKEKKKKKSKDKDKDRDKEKSEAPVKELEPDIKTPEPEAEPEPVAAKKESPPPSSAPSAGKKKMRAQRATSNVFAMFGQSQIQEFKEAFTLIDQDRDGFISKEDLKDMYASLGKDARDKDLEEMLSEAPGPINFTMFLTLFGDKLSGTDTEDVIKNAFKIVDEKGDGKIKESVLRDYLTGMGERFSSEEVADLIKNAPFTDGAGFYDYTKLAHLITHGSDEA